jgi:hypothetical protein
VRDDMASESEQPVRGGNDLSALKYIVARHAELNAQLKEIKFEQKELEDSAWEKCGKSAKAIKQLSKESAWDEVRRERQRLLEEEIDAGRAALGMLADTPLGGAELTRMEEERVTRGWKADDAPKRRGRPPGSKNKPKAAA